VTRKGEFVDYQICSLCNNILQIIIKMTLGRPRDNDGVLSWKDFSNALLNPDNTSLGTLCFHEVDRLLDIMSAYNKLQSSKKKEKNSEDCDTYRISNKDLYDEAVSKLQEIAPDNIQDDKYGLKNYFHKYKIANQIKNLIKSIHNEDKIESNIMNNIDNENEEDDDAEEDTSVNDEDEIKDEDEDEGDDESSDNKKKRLRIYTSATFYLNVLMERMMGRVIRASYDIAFVPKRNTLQPSDVDVAMGIILVGDLGAQIYNSTKETVNEIIKYKNNKKAERAKMRLAEAEATSEEVSEPVKEEVSEPVKDEVSEPVKGAKKTKTKKAKK